MLKINKYLYIHFTTVLLFAVCYFNRKLELLTVSYATIFLHEAAHLAAALAIGLKPAHIIFFPFGVNLKLKNSIIYSICDEIILYLTGPLSNILMAVAALKFCKNSHFRDIFYYNNMALFIFNMLPIMPMDGGIILKKIIARKIGSRNANIYMKAISAILICFLIFGEVYLLINNRFNYSILFAAVFLTGNIFTNTEKYHVDLTKELLFYKNKDKFDLKKVKTYIIKENTDYRRLAENFAQGYYYVIFKENGEGRIKNILSEREIIDEILNNR